MNANIIKEGGLDMEILIQGILLQASLILTLGAQNSFMIEVGLKKKNHFLAAGICAVCDVTLIFFGIFSVSEFIVKFPLFKLIVGSIGFIFLFSFGVLKLYEGIGGRSATSKWKNKSLGKKEVVLATLGFTLLNPHVYLETVFVIGGYSTQFIKIVEKLLFGAGAGFFSILWFYFIAIFSSRFARVLSHENNLKKVSLATGLILTYLSFKLGKETFDGLLLYFG